MTNKNHEFKQVFFLIENLLSQRFPIKGTFDITLNDIYLHHQIFIQYLYRCFHLVLRNFLKYLLHSVYRENHKNPAFIVRQYPILQKAMYQSSNVSSGTFYDFILVFSSFNLCVSQKELTLLKT